MKKLLLVLMVVALASFLFVGCTPTVPAEGEGEGEGETVVSACPTVSVTSEVEIEGVKYIKGAKQTITVTFAEATEMVSVYVTAALKDNPSGVPSSAVELVMYPDADNKVWTGTNRFGVYNGSECVDGYVYVSTCTTCAPCKFAYVVDEYGPCSEILISEYPTTGCSCGGVNINFASTTVSCATCCNDECTGFDTATFDLYKSDPFDTCCDVPCISPIATCTSVGCPIDCTISCFNIYDYYTYVAGATYNDAEEDFFLVATLADLVGNKTYYYATIVMDSSTVGLVTEYIDDQDAGSCTGWTDGEKAVANTTTGVIGACAGAYDVCGTVADATPPSVD